MIDGFHSSASDPALQKKYGHVKSAINIAPPPITSPAANVSAPQYSMFSNQSQIGNISRYVAYDAHTNAAMVPPAPTHLHSPSTLTPTHSQQQQQQQPGIGVLSVPPPPIQHIASGNLSPHNHSAGVGTGISAGVVGGQIPVPFPPQMQPPNIVRVANTTSMTPPPPRVANAVVTPTEKQEPGSVTGGVGLGLAGGVARGPLVQVNIFNHDHGPSDNVIAADSNSSAIL